MYSLLLCSALALLVAVGGILTGIWHWAWSIPIGVFVFVVSWILLARSLSKRLVPATMQMQKQMEAGMPQAALETMRGMLPMARWIPMLRGQLLAHMGAINWRIGKREEGLAMLRQSSPRVGEARLLLACILWRDGKEQEALDVLKVAAMFNKKHGLLHNTYAWMLAKEGKDGEAIAVLAKFVQKQKAEEIAKDNLLRLQNGKKMSMAGYGMHWYALELEAPPASYGQVQQVRKGFRTPPKQRGKNK